MAGRPGVKRDKMVLEFIHIVFVVNIFNTIPPCRANTESHGQGNIYVGAVDQIFWPYFVAKNWIKIFDVMLMTGVRSTHRTSHQNTRGLI